MMHFRKPLYRRHLISIKNGEIVVSSESEPLNYSLNLINRSLLYLGSVNVHKIYRIIYNDYKRFEEVFDLCPALFPFRAMYWLSDPSLDWTVFPENLAKSLMVPCDMYNVPRYRNLSLAFQMPQKVEDDLKDIITRVGHKLTNNIDQDYIFQAAKANYPRYFSVMGLHKSNIPNTAGFFKMLKTNEVLLINFRNENDPEAETYIKNVYSRKFFSDED